MKTVKYPMTVKKGNSIVKIYYAKRGQYHKYKIAYYSLGIRKTETFSEFDRAKDRAEEINDSVNNGNAETLSMSASDRLAFTNAMSALKPSGVSLQVAAMDYAEAQKLLGPVSILTAARYYVAKNPISLQRKPIAEITKEYLQSLAARGLSMVYRNGMRTMLERFESAFHCDLVSVTAPQLEKFFETPGTRSPSRRKFSHVSATTFNNSWKHMASFFVFARKKGYLPSDWNEVGRVEKRKRHDAEIEIYTPSEIQKMLSSITTEKQYTITRKTGVVHLAGLSAKGKAAQNNLRAVIAIGAFAGVRMNEIMRMNWEQIGVGDGKYIEIKASGAKKAQRRLIPYADNLKAWLAPVMKTTGKIWPTTIPCLNFYTRKLAKECGLKWKANGLRHSYISYRVAETSNVPEVALEAGNSPQIIFQHYRQLVSREEALKWFAVGPSDAAEKITYLKTARG